MSTDRFLQFKSNTGRARDLVALGQSIGGMTAGRVDASDLHRAALVQAVAALDSYVHGVVLDRAVDMLLGRTAHAVRSTKVGLHFTAIADLLTAGSSVEQELAARRHVAQRLALETYQRPDDIASALALVSIPRIWRTAFSDAQAAQVALGTVVNRRNRIVHACDVDPLTPGTVTAMQDADALDALATVERTVKAIDPFCRQVPVPPTGS